MRLRFCYFLPAILGLVVAAATRPAFAQQTITCSSDDGGRHYCHVDARGGVQLANQRSGAACQQGYSWGYDRDGIWVDHGCRADFTVNSSRRGFGGGGQVITCSSDDGGRHSCPVDARGGVQITNQRSGSACQQGYSWGYDQRGIWVDHGCRADFMVNSYNSWNNGGGGQSLTCSSDDGGRHYCSADTRGGVQMRNQRSDARCQQGYSWGYDQRGIWVDHGCRADFITGGGDGPPEPGMQRFGQVGGGDAPPEPGMQRFGQTGGGDGPPEPGMQSFTQTITCASDDGGRHYCRAVIHSGVQMVKQRSDARCQQGYSWGYDQRGIWVDHGCRADFAAR